MSSSSGAANDQRAYLAKIARLYYGKEMNQREIGKRLNISVAGVSRALSKAKELGIIRVTIDEPQDSLAGLEISMETAWGLKECLVVPHGGDIDVTWDSTDAYLGMAQKTSDLLSRVLKDGSKIGVSWGKTLKNVGANIERMELPNVGVIPIIGAMGTVETGIYPNSIAREFADKIGGTTYLMNTPAVVDAEETRIRLQQDSNFELVRETWKQLDLAMLSVSALTEQTSVFESGVFSREDLAGMREAGGVCATNFSVIDAEGTLLDLPISRRITNLPFEQLRSIAHVVVISGGHQKIEPLRAVLRSGVVSHLVTDEACARALIDPSEADRL